MANTKIYAVMMDEPTITTPEILSFLNDSSKINTHSLFYFQSGFPLPFIYMYEAKAILAWQSLPFRISFNKRDYEKSLKRHKHDAYIQELLWLNPLHFQVVNKLHF